MYVFILVEDEAAWPSNACNITRSAEKSYVIFDSSLFSLALLPLDGFSTSTTLTELNCSNFPTKSQQYFRVCQIQCSMFSSTLVWRQPCHPLWPPQPLPEPSKERPLLWPPPSIHASAGHSSRDAGWLCLLSMTWCDLLLLEGVQTLLQPMEEDLCLEFVLIFWVIT